MPLLAEEKELRCPICKKYQQCAHKMGRDSGDPLIWYHCYCDTLFHTENLSRELYNKEYVDEWRNRKDVEVCFKYLIRTYVPLIEELTYGRKFLDIGFTLPVRIKEMNARGWLSTGIDLIDNDYCTGDFETYDFKDETFDFLLMGHVLQSFKDPVKAIEKAHSLLNDAGVLMITTPSPELSRVAGPKYFAHWYSPEAWIFISQGEMEKIAMRSGFRVAWSEHNISKRFDTWNDLHIIMVKE